WRRARVHSGAASLARFELIGSWRLAESYLSLIRAVTAADVQRVARRYFPTDRKNAAVLLPAEPQAPADKGSGWSRGPSGSRWLGVSLAELPAPGGLRRGHLLRGRREVPQAARLSPERERSPMRRVQASLILLAVAALPAAALAAPLAHREVMANGVRLLVAPRPGIPIVVVRAYVRAGSAFDPPEAPGLANLTAELLTRGTAHRTGPEIDRAVEFVGGSLEADAGRDGTTVSLAVLKKDLELGLDLLAEVLLEPAFPEDELRRKVADIEAALRRSEESPETVAARALAKLLYPGHPYAHPVPGTVESVPKLTREQVVAFHRARYRPDATTIAVVGDVTVDLA